jgi:hypothetical protein
MSPGGQFLLSPDRGCDLGVKLGPPKRGGSAEARHGDDCGGTRLVRERMLLIIGLHDSPP